jgi:hypothetical protein
MEEENAILIYNHPVTYTGVKISFEQTYLFVIKQQVVPTTTTSTTTTTAATSPTTMASNTTDESVSVLNAVSAGITDVKPNSKPSAACAQTSAAHFALCISVFLVWLVKQ